MIPTPLDIDDPCSVLRSKNAAGSRRNRQARHLPCVESCQNGASKPSKIVLDIFGRKAMLLGLLDS
jgi:hypothetical protein